MYQNTIYGKSPDWDQLNRFLGQWYADYQAKEDEQKRTRKTTTQKATSKKSAPKKEKITPSQSEKEGDPALAKEPDPMLIAGGVVTAAVDAPSAEDHLGRKPLVKTLAAMLASPEQKRPMTIALLGDWGSGKSSVILQIKERLKMLAEDKQHNRYLFAEFNAWEYEQTDNIQAGLAQEVVRGLTEGMDGWAKLRLAIDNAAAQHGWDFYFTVMGLSVTAVLGILGVFNLDKLETLQPMTQSVLGTGGAAVLIFTLARTWQQTRRFLEHPLAEKMSTYLQLPNYGKHLGLVPIIRKEIKSLCSARLKEDERLLVVVDDLDRCKPGYITETLDAIRLVMNLNKVVVIVAIDDRIAFQAVANHYKGLASDARRSKEEIARDYLGKIIQLPINLYKPWPNEVSAFIKNHLFEVEKAIEGAVTKNREDAGNYKINPLTPPTNDPPPKPSAVVRRLLDEQGIDPNAIAGTGQNGRIRKADVLLYLEKQEQADKKKEAQLPDSNASTAQSGATEDLNRLMKDTAFERDLFAKLADSMRFRNPRQLIRLRNSYRLLKGYRHSCKGSDLDQGLVEYLMHGLFWYEYLYQRTEQERSSDELRVWEWRKNPKWEKIAAGREDNPPVVIIARWLHKVIAEEDWDIEYPNLMHTVAMVVLPNAEMGLILKRVQADDALKKRSTDSNFSLDPWG